MSHWWRSSVVYQLYLKSFLDTDGDGFGDLDGVVGRLDHIVSLGVDGIWLNPCFPSPQRDGGYDVADYLTIDALYGGLPAFERLRDAAHERGLKLLLDLVPNHCSDQHAWFQEALAAGAGSPERERFVFANGRGADGSQPPNNWRSIFGGSAWQRVADGQWYLHLFDATQPDFNWDCPEVADMFDHVLRTWFDRGIDGFRIDVAHGMVKAAGLPDAEDDEAALNPYAWNQPAVHDIFRRWRKIADGYDRDLTLVGEAWVPPGDSADYIRSDELQQVFYFDLMLQPFEAAAFRASVEAAYASLSDDHGVPTWTLNNHDVHRSVSRYGLVEPEPTTSSDPQALAVRRRGRVDVELGTRRATAALLFTLALPGSVYLYQGEELGLPEVQDLPDEARQDPMWERSGHTDYGRDGSRVPLPWAAGEPAYGFSSGLPWLPQPDWFADLAADRQEHDPGSVLNLYRAALVARRDLDATAPVTWLDTGRADVLAFRRGTLTCVTVFGGPAYEVPADWGHEVLTTRDGGGRALPADTAGWYRS
jgi:alpha-glucosidase